MCFGMASWASHEMSYTEAAGSDRFRLGVYAEQGLFGSARAPDLRPSTPPQSLATRIGLGPYSRKSRSVQCITAIG